jgi:PPOX class probable F420-dependent enzyme
MSREELREFLKAPRPGVLATVRPDGRPHAAPVWWDADGDDLVFTTGAETVKGRNLRADPRATLVVQDARPPYSFVTIEGSVAMSEDSDELRRWAARLGGRYMGEDRAGEYGARNAVPGELLVRLRPDKIVSARDVAD